MYIYSHAPPYSIMMMHPISFEGVGPRRGMEAEIAPFCLATPRAPHTACEDSRFNMTDLSIDSPPIFFRRCMFKFIRSSMYIRLRNKKIKVLKKLFAVQMRWISADELDDHDDAEPEDSSDALVPADEVDDNVAEHEDDVLGAINDLGHDAEPDASNDLGHDAEPGASNDSGHDAPSGAGSDSGAESSADKSIPKVPKDL